MSRKYKNIRYKDTGGSNIDLSGIVEHMIPTIDSDGIIGQDLGAPNKKWRDLYLSKGSLYIDGQKVIESNNGTITVQADANQSLLTQTSGTGSLQLSSDNGIQLMGEVNAGTGDLNIGTNIDMNTSLVRELGSPLLGTDAANKNYVDSQVVAALDAGNNISAADLTVSGNLTVSGTTTTVNSETISLADNIIDLNSNFTSGSPTENAGLKVKRGDDADVQIRWNEASDQWEYTNDGVAYSAIGSGSVDLSGYDTSAEVDAKVAAVDLSGYDTSAEVDAKVANASGGSSDHDFVASGTLPDGAPVVLKADGTIEAVGGVVTTYPESIPAGPEAVFNSAGAWAISAAFDPNDSGKFVVCYRDANDAYSGTAIIGTVSGTSISFGSKVVFNSGNTDFISVAFDPNTAGQFVVCYQDDTNSEYGTAIVGTVSGTSISFGSEAVFNSEDTQTAISVAFDPNTAGQFVVCYVDGGNSNINDYSGTAIIGTVSGTSISFGSEYVFNSGGYANFISVAFDPNTVGQFVVCYQDGSNSYKGTAIVGTVSGTSISFGSAVVFNSGNTYYISVSFDPNTAGQFVVCYVDGGNSNYDLIGNSNLGTACVGTVSGTSISFGSEAVFNSGVSRYISAAFDPNNSGKFVVCYRNSADNGIAYVGTVSGTSISFGSEAVLSSGYTSSISAAFNPNTAGQFVVCYCNSYYGIACAGEIETFIQSPTNLTADNFIGVSTSAYADGETATITLDGGISTNQSGLTVGSTYHVLDDGTLSTTSTATSSEVGKALSSTDLQIDTKRAVDLSSYDTSTEVDAKVAAVDLSGYDTSAEVDAKVAAVDLSGYDTSAEVDAKVAAVDLSGYDTSAEVDAKVANASGGSSDHDFVASGTLPDGAPVVLKADGTIEAVGGVLVTTVSESIPAGPAAVFSSGGPAYWLAAANDPNSGKFVVCYRDAGNSNYGTACVGTVSGTSISFGSEVVFNSRTTSDISVSFDPNTAGQFVICYADDTNSFAGTAVVGTVSGTNISFGSEVGFNNTGSWSKDITVAFNPNTAGQFVVFYTDYSNNYYGTAIIGTVSGTSISFGSGVVFNSGGNNFMKVAFDPNNAGKFVVCYRKSPKGTAIVGTVSGTSLSFGSEVVFNSGATTEITAAAFDPNTAGQFVVCCLDNTNNTLNGTSYVGTISGTSISFGSQNVFNAGQTESISVAFNPDTANELVVCYRDQTDPLNGTAIVGTVSGTSISFGSEAVFSSVRADHNSVFFDPNNAGQFVVCYGLDGHAGAAIVGQLAVQGINTNLTSDNFIGVSTSAYADGETATITLDGGISTNQSGLTVGSTYHVLDDGTLSTTSTATSSEVGKALSSTDLQIDTKRAVDLSGYDTSAEVDAKVAALVDSAPGALDTLNELAAAIGDDANYVAAVTTAMATKATTSYVDTAVAAVDFSNYDTSAEVDAKVANASGSSGSYSDSDVLTYLSGGWDFHLLPDTNATYDIGSAEKKVRHLFLSDNSLYIGANTLRTAGNSLLFDGEDVQNYANIKNKPTTLAGYGITDEVDAKVANASGGSSDHDFVASGTLPDGAPVVLKADGTIEAVTSGYVTAVSESIPAGPEAVFNSAAPSYYVVAAKDPNNSDTFVVCYKDDTNYSGYGTACVGTISGTSISFGPKFIFNSGNTYDISVAFDPNTAGQFVVCYQDAGSGTAVVGTVSGTSISFSPEIVFNSSSTSYISVAFDPNNAGKFVTCYTDGGNSDKGTAIVGTVSGTSISFGPEIVFNSGNTYYMSAAFDPNNSGKFVVCYRDDGNSDKGTACVGTISGTSISFGSGVVFNPGNTTQIRQSFDPNTAGQFVVCYADGGNSSIGTACVGTISGTSISFGSESVFSGSNTAYNMSVAFNPDTANELVVCYQDGGFGPGAAKVGTVSGASISFGSAVIYKSGDIRDISVFFDPNNAGKFVVCYGYTGGAMVGQLAVQAVNTNLTSDNFIGVSTSAYADGETATITLDGGISTNQVGLTVGEIYHVLDDGTLSTTSTATSTEVGKALSSTDLQIDTKQAVDFSNYDTSTEVDAKVAAVDLSGYDTSAEVDAKVAAVDLSGYDTSAEVDAKVAAVDLSGYDTSAEVDAKVAALVDSAPGALDTLNELAAALGDDANYAASVATTMATKATTSYVDTAVAAHAPTWSEITTSTTVTANSRNLVDTSVGSITITLPANPTLGDEVTFIDASGYAATNNITVDSNGEKIQGETGDLLINVNRAAFQVVYHNVANGWVLMEV